MKAPVVGVICTLLLGLAGSPARGYEDKVGTSNINPQTFSDSSFHYLNLTGAPGGDSIVVRSPNVCEDEWITIWFAAECAVAAADTRTWVDIDILVNGYELPPTDENNAFCTSTGTSSLSWVSAATHGFIDDVVNHPMIHFPPGACEYTIRARARLQQFNPGERWTIDDLSLIFFVE